MSMVTVLNQVRQKLPSINFNILPSKEQKQHLFIASHLQCRKIGFKACDETTYAFMKVFFVCVLYASIRWAMDGLCLTARLATQKLEISPLHY